MSSEEIEKIIHDIVFEKLNEIDKSINNESIISIIKTCYSDAYNHGYSEGYGEGQRDILSQL